MPLIKMTLYTQNDLINNQTQYLINQQIIQNQTQPVIRLGSSINRNFLPLYIQGNKYCKSCSGK